VRRACALGFVLVGCAAAVPIASAPAPCDPSAIEEDERCVGRALDHLLTSDAPRIEDEGLTAYVEGIGARVAASSGTRGWTFRVLEDLGAGAFVLPGGYVYVTLGLLRLAADEAEVAAALAHEMAHSIAGHAWIDTVDLALDEGAVVGAIERDHDEERQADEIAIGLLEASGYDPRALRTLLDRLASLETEPALRRALLARATCVDRSTFGRSGSRGGDALARALEAFTRVDGGR
jgi:predicted Zn-dependent protease